MQHCLLLISLIVCSLSGWLPAAVVRLDTDAISSGRLPAGLVFKTEAPEASVIRVVREFAPCVKIEFEQACRWDLSFPAVAVEPGKRYTFAITLATVAQAGKGYTPDIANFRPENQAGQEIVSDQAGTAVIDLGGFSSLAVKPGGWKVLHQTFTVPSNSAVRAVAAKMSGSGGGLFFIADAAVIDGGEPAPLFLPEAETLDLLLNAKSKQPQTIIAPGKTWGVYLPGEPIVWKVAAPADQGFKSFEYKILDTAGTVLRRENKTFPAEVSFPPAGPGYYELVIRSTAGTDPQTILHDLQGAAVITKLDGVKPGSNPFASGSSPYDLARLVGLSWTRGGIIGARSDIGDVTDESARQQAAEMMKNGIMPLEHIYNITYKTNAHPPGTNDDLPVDLDKFEQAFKRAASLGDRFSRHYEFWNEPEGRLGATPHWTIENFTKALIAAHKGVKAANPEAKVGIGSNLELVGGVNRCGGQDAYEFLILHPYPWSVGKKWNTPEDGMVLEVCLSARQWLDTHGGKDKEIWSTEFGYTTGSTISGCSEPEQARMIVRTSLLQLAGGLKYISQFRMDDVWFWGQVDGRFGLLRASYTPKPSLAAYATLVRAVRGLPYQGRFDAGKNVAVLVFGNEKETVVATWTNTDEKKLALKCPAEAYQMDLFGKTCRVKELTLTDSVQYVLAPVSYRQFVKDQPVKFIPGFSGGIFDAKLERKHYELPVLAAVPEIDGRLETWTGEPIRMNNPSQGFSAEIQAAATGEFLLLSAQVRGDVPGKNPNLPQKIWNGDGLELYFTPEPNTRPLGFYRESDFHLGIAPGTDGKTGKVANILAGVDPAIPGAAARYVKLKDGYDLEAKIPLAFFKLKSIKPGDRFGFDVQLGIGTSDGESRRWQETWSGTGQNYISPYLWGDATAVQKKTEHLGWTMGVWPGGLHNSSLTTQILELDQPVWTFDSPSSLYAVVGAWIDNWKTFVETRGKELVLGGDRFFHHATAIWKFQAPPGNRFAGGTVVADLSREGTGGDEGCYLAVGTKLSLIGGGSFWKGFHGFNSPDFKKAAVRDPGRKRMTLEIPSGVDTFYVAVSRDNLADGRSAKVTLHSLEVRPRLANPYGLTLRFDRAEPVWSRGEPIRLRAVATGNPPPKQAWWALAHRDGSVHRTGSSFDIDLTSAEAGYFTLRVFDRPEMKNSLDAQDLVILYPQDPAVTSETSLFGVMGSEFDLAKRMGVKWAVAGYQWAWNQPGPKDPIQGPDAGAYRQYRQNGIEPIVHIDTAPGWANGGKTAAAAPEKKFYPHWLAFNQRAAATLKDGATWFQSWNEPNNNSAFEFKPWDPAKVATKAKEIQRVQYRGLKKGNPDARLIGGCFAGAPADWVAMWLTGSDSTLKFQDAMSGHPYCEAFEKEGYQHKRPPEPTLIPQLLAIRKTMDAHSAKKQPLFWTEFGWDTGCTSDDDQARWTARHLIIQQAYREQLGTKAVCLFSFGYNTSYCTFYPTQMVRPGTHRFRPAIGAYATVAGILAGSKLKARISDYPNPVYLYAFTKGNTLIYVAWATEEAKTRAVKLPLVHRQSAVQVSLLGERTNVTLDPNLPTLLPENHDPVFWIVGD